MAYPTISDLPSAPQRTQTPDAFSTTADAFVAALPDLVTEVNAAGAYIDNKTISVGNDFQGTYAAGTTYSTGQSVLSGGLFYLSLVDSNTGNTPASSPSQWVQISGNVGAAGGVVEFTADGAITAGDLVALQSDGTVAAIAESASTTPVVGGTGEASPNSPQQLVSVFDSTNNKVAYVYRNASTGYATGVVGTVSGTTISFGTETVLGSDNYFPEGIAFDTSVDEVVVWYKHNSLDNMYIRTASITGTEISSSYNRLISTTAANSNSCAAVYDSSNNKTVVVGEQGGPSTVAWVIEVTGSGITDPGSGATIVSQNWEHVALGYDSTNSKVVIFGRNAANNQYYASVGTVSGTSSTWGTAVSVTSNTISDTDVAFDSNAGKFLLCYKDAGNSNYLYGVVGTVSGSSISFGTPAAIASVSFNYTQVEFNPDQNKFCVTWRESSRGKAVFVTLSGTDFTTSSVTEFTTGDYVIPTTHDNLIYDTNSDKFVTSYRDSDSDAAATVIGTTSTNVADWIGVAADSISDSASGNITVIGGVNEEQTGLTPNTVIYAQSDGSLSSTVSNYKVGRAIASDKVLITEGNA